MVLNIFYVHPYLGKWSNFTNIFWMGWNHQLATIGKSPLNFKPPFGRLFFNIISKHHYSRKSKLQMFFWGGILKFESQPHWVIGSINSHCFHMIAHGYQLERAYVSIIRISYTNSWMTIPPEAATLNSHTMALALLKHKKLLGSHRLTAGITDQWLFLVPIKGGR